jgi:hypothetical protein
VQAAIDGKLAASTGEFLIFEPRKSKIPKVFPTPVANAGASLDRGAAMVVR